MAISGRPVAHHTVQTMCMTEFPLVLCSKSILPLLIGETRTESMKLNGLEGNSKPQNLT